jgi:hypothetical protein
VAGAAAQVPSVSCAPVPGPISSTTSVFLMPDLSTMD